MARSLLILLSLYSICVYSLSGTTTTSKPSTTSISTSTSSVSGSLSSSPSSSTGSSSTHSSKFSSSDSASAPSSTVSAPGPTSTASSTAPSVATETGDTCDADPVWTTSSTASSSPIMTTAPPKPSCSLQNEDPDQGINTQGCICGSTTLPLLTVASPTDESQSCAYTAWPSSTVSNPIKVESQVWTSKCQACTLVGGIADTPSCTSVSGCQPPATPTPTLSVNLSNTTVTVGDEDGINGGADLRKNMYKDLQALCPPGGNQCTSVQFGVIDHIKSLSIDLQPDEGRLNFTINTSSYNSQKERDQMLAAATTVWEQAVHKSCKSVPYRSQPFPATQGTCTTGPVMKRRKDSTDSMLEDRSPIRENPCEFNAHLCVGPSLISIELGNSTDSDANYMDIEIDWLLDTAPVDPISEFICEAIVDGLTSAAIELAPELAELDILADIDLKTQCSKGVQKIFSD